MNPKLIIFVKAPVPGKVKTRLVPPLSHKEAASLYRSWSREIYDKAKRHVRAALQVAYVPDASFPNPQWISGTGGEVSFFTQQGQDLGERMSRAFTKAFQESFDRVILIGSDSPGLPAEYINDGFLSLENHDLVLGPTPDGGYYLIGLKNRFPQGLFDGVEWSTSSVLERTLKNAQTLGLHKSILPEYFDVDHPEDLARIAPRAKIQKISVVIPARNEKKTLQKQIERLRQTSLKVPTEIVVVDGASTDGTRELALNLADSVVLSARASRGEQMSLGAEKAAGDLLFFLHADTQVPDPWQEILIRTFSEPRDPVSGAAFGLSFDSSRWEYRVIEILVKARSWITGVPHGDQGLAVTRQAYVDSGGFPKVPLMEEYFFIPKLREAGKFVILNEKIKTSARKYEKFSPFVNALKNSIFLGLFFLGVSPDRLAVWYQKGDRHE